MACLYNYPKNELINIKKQLELYQADILVNDLPKNDDEIKKKLKFTGPCSKFDKIIDSVSLDENLENEDEILILKFDPSKSEKYKRKSILQTPEGAFALNTVKETIKLRQHQKTYRKFGSLFGKTAFTYKFVSQDLKPSDNELELIKPYSDVIISIRFYSPFRYNQGQTTYGPRFNEEFLVLGSQFLTDLRDEITCITNNRRLFDISLNIDQDPIINDCNPGFFYITDTFYNDLRNTNNPDYSQVIREWANKKKFDTNEFKTSSMDKTRFSDLNIRLGFPQVYQHHGNCEHLFTFSSIQIISPDDNLNRNNYPILNTVALSNVTTCSMCGTREYSVLIKGSNRQLADPCYLCRVCFENFHYIDGKKIGDFKAYNVNPNSVVKESDEE